MSEDTPLQVAQQRLAQAALKQPMHPSGAAISSYVNGMFQSARIDALIDVLNSLPLNTTWNLQDAIDAAILRHVTQKAEELESQAIRMNLAQAAAEANSSRIALPS